MIDPGMAQTFLDGKCIAVVGASDDPKSFGGIIFRALLDHGIDAVAVNPRYDTVSDRPCYPALTAVPDDTTIDGVLVVVPKNAAVDVVNQAIARHVPRVWLFKGVGGTGAVSDEAVALCHDHGIEVIPGACPLMFLEPVRGVHRFHRTIRHLNHSLAREAA
jgi:predicted CoA-binding protein